MKVVQVKEILQEVLDEALQEEAVIRTTTSWKPSKVTQMRMRILCELIDWNLTLFII